MADATIQLTLNGEARSLAAPSSVASLVDRFALDPRKIAIERNAEIVPRSRYADTWLSPGDAIEIVHFIGGG